MKTLLIFPPASDPAHPPLGIAMLAGYLSARRKKVDLLDLNLNSYYYLLSSENITLCAEKMSNRLQELESKHSLEAIHFKEYSLIAENLVSADYIKKSTKSSLQSLKRVKTYSSRTRYTRSSSIIRRAMEFVSAAHYPVRWYPRGFSMSYLPTRSADVLKATSDRQQNLFISFYESCLSDISKLEPDIIGISINYYCQLIPAITLATILKKRFPSKFIVAGGGLICFFEDQWNALLPFKGIVDAFIPYEGELPLFSLIEALEKQKDISKVSGLLRFSGNQLLLNPPPLPPAIQKLPIPDFSGLRLDKYLSPRLILPNLTSRGCYWGRCAFCSHYHLYREGFRKKSASQVLKETKELSERFKADIFYFTDECIPPLTAQAIAAGNKGRTRFSWFGECRFEISFNSGVLQRLAAGGCRMLMFGLESGQQRLLDLMEKGTNCETISRILCDCSNSGIRTFAMFFVGFPTEGRDDAEGTIAFIGAHKDYITHIAFSNFILEKHSKVYASPEKFWISPEKSSRDDDMKIFAAYNVAKGLTEKEAVSFVEQIKERSEITSLISTYFISRSHLVFLPHKEASPQKSMISQSKPLESRIVYPVLHNDVMPLKLRFNLDRIRRKTRKSEDLQEKGRIFESSTNYFFSPESEKMIEVGKDGLSLAGVCNGTNSLKKILLSVNREERDTVLAFYTRLCETGFLYFRNDRK